MKKPKPAKPKYLEMELEGEMPFKMYSAASGQQGGGYLVIHETWVDVILHPDAEWKQQLNDNWKESNKLMADDGSLDWRLLMVRAFFYTRESLEKNEHEMRPALNESQALNQLRMAAKASARAQDARTQAALTAARNGIEIPEQAISNDRDYVEWFEGQVEKKLDANDHEFVETTCAYTRATNRLLASYPMDVLCFMRALRDQAWLAGAPPTKENVRLAMGREMNSEIQKARKDVMRPDQGGYVPPARSSATDTIKPDDFTEMLKLTGFQWLPNGKPGPKRKHSAGKK